MKAALFIGSTVALLQLPVPAAHAQVANFRPLPTAEPYRETVFGTELDDPWRWMEDEKRKDELAAWMRASSAHSRSQLAGLPGYPELLSAITAASKSKAAVYSVRAAKGRLFYEYLAADADRLVLMVREGGRDRVLVDPGKEAAIGTYQPSPDGRLVAVHLSSGGSEVGATYIYDVATGKRLPDVLTPMWTDPVGWADNRTLLYMRMARTSGKDIQHDVSIYVHGLGQPAASDVPLLGSVVKTSVAVSSEEAAIPAPAIGSEWTLGTIGQARADSRVAIARTADLAAGRAKWTAFADYKDQVTRAAIHGDTLYFMTTKDLADGEVRSVDLKTPVLTASKRVLGGSGLVLKEFAAARDGLYVTVLRPDGSSRVLFVSRRGGSPQEVALPFAGAIRNLDNSPDGGPVIMSLTGWLRDTQFYRLVNGKASSMDLGNETDTALVGGARVVEEVAVSKDGTRVPLTILAPPQRFAGVRPTILEAYAAYGTVASPFFGPVTLTWVNRGGVYASCHARGGGEKGRAWHEAGRGPNKPRGQEDVIACGERLVALGLASPKTLGLWGTSAGGTLVGPAALARPDLFRAVTASVAMLNPTALARGENGTSQFAEFGDPRTPEGFRALLAQDSIASLRTSKGGPDFLFTVGLNDHRVPFWNSAKVNAAMRAKWGDDHLALLRVDGQAGHSAGSGRDQTLALRADMYAFFLNRFGQPGFALR